MSQPLLTHLRDFPDRLPPMLVKELRQGLRAKAFVAVFLILQGLLGIILLTATASQGGNDVGATVSSIIFFFISLVLLIFQPLRGISALASEMKANTMEIMALTRLSAWRITFGKWSAIVSQSALMVAAIIPYLILRYFLGGMQLFAELLMLLAIFILSAALTAMAVGMSANRSLVLRALFPLALIPLGFSMLGGALFGSGMNELTEFFSLSSVESREVLAVATFFVGYLGWLSLDFGASMIAPMAENRATFRRIVGLALAGVVIALLRPVDDEVQIAVSFLFMLPLILVSLAEPLNVTAPILRRFTQRGPLGTLASWIFCPGWASGVLYSFALVALFCGAALFLGLPGDPDELAIHIYGAIGGLLFPAVVLLFVKVSNRFAGYLIILASSVILMGFLSIVANAMNQEDLLYFFIWLPPVAWPLWAETNNESSIALISSVLGSLYVLALLVGAVLATLRLRRSLRSPAAQS
jgi:hypothetical protein